MGEMHTKNIIVRDIFGAQMSKLKSIYCKTCASIMKRPKAQLQNNMLNSIHYDQDFKTFGPLRGKSDYSPTHLDSTLKLKHNDQREIHCPNRHRYL